MNHAFARALAIAALALSLAGSPAGAQEADDDDPAFVTLGVGAYDVIATDDVAADFRLEYRHDERLWIFKPWAGIEGTSDGAVYGLGGLLVDVYFGRRIVVTPSFGVGAYYDGDGKDLGSTVEFRSQLELAYRFDDRSRLGLAISHISNASIGDENPGTEIVNLYYSIPLHRIFPSGR